MFLLKKSLDCCLKCNSPRVFVNRKKYIRRKQEIAQLQVLGTGAPDQPASVLLNVGHKLYLFNCGEGFATVCQDHKFNIMKIDNIFFTQSKWNCIGGVTGLISPKVAVYGYPPTFHGPNNLHQIIIRLLFLSYVGGQLKHRSPKTFLPQIENFFTTNQRFEDDKLIIEPIELQHENETAVIYVCKLKASRGRYSHKKVSIKMYRLKFWPI